MNNTITTYGTIEEEAKAFGLATLAETTPWFPQDRAITDAKYYCIEGCREVLRFYQLEPGWMENEAESRAKRDYGFHAAFKFRTSVSKLIHKIHGELMVGKISEEQIELFFRTAIQAIEEA